MKIYCVVGARPNFVKMARLFWEFAKFTGVEPILIHTNQHHDTNMSSVFFEQLGLPEPHVKFTDTWALDGAHRFGYIMQQMEEFLIQADPGIVVVVGDVDSSLACALAAKRQGYPIAHVEAGLRSGDMEMPEEVNRKLIDQISTLLFCTEQAGVDNLAREGVLSRGKQQVHLVGNTMMDTLIHMKGEIDRHSYAKKRFGVATLHRPSNVDDRNQLSKLLDTLEQIGETWGMSIMFPMHPRLAKAVQYLPRYASRQFKWLEFEKPKEYVWFLSAVKQARIVFTDSGGVQEEAAFFKTPCVTLRTTTERPCTLSSTNRIGGVHAGGILAAAKEFEGGRVGSDAAVPDLWLDGKASARIAQITADWWL